MTQRPFEFRSRVSAHSNAPPETVYRVVSDLRAHLVWSGERASDPTFKLLTVEAPEGPATVGTTFASTGANFNGTFNDRSVVSEADPPRRFVISTDAQLDRKRGKPWEVHFEHRYDIEPDSGGSRITYTESITRLNYVPYWLNPLMRPLTRAIINRADRKQLTNLARFAEERSGSETHH